MNDNLFRDTREITVTAKFTITDEYMNDDSDPDIDLEYAAQDSKELCQVDPEDTNCNRYQWWEARFVIQDDDSGLHTVQVSAGGKQQYYDQNNIYYRYSDAIIKKFRQFCKASLDLEHCRW